MTLHDFVLMYDGNMLFEVRETISDNLIVSFDKNEMTAIKAEILERPVEKFRADVATVVGGGSGKTYKTTLVVVLSTASAELPGE